MNIARNVSGILAAILAAAIILGAALLVMSFPAWIVWAVTLSVLLLAISTNHRVTALIAAAAGLLFTALYVGLPAMLGAIAKGFLP
ncbi:MAG: hypothetical protein P4M09_17105 [Devosia sp.]|nr:hypothetical protein [Devosia sp.]